MAWRMFFAKPLSDPMLASDNGIPRQKIKSNLNQFPNIFIAENENKVQYVVCKIATVLLRPGWLESGVTQTWITSFRVLASD